MKFVVLVDFTDKARQNPKSIQEFTAKMSESAKSVIGSDYPTRTEISTKQRTFLLLKRPQLT